MSPNYDIRLQLQPGGRRLLERSLDLLVRAGWVRERQIGHFVITRRGTLALMRYRERRRIPRKQRTTSELMAAA